MTPDQRLIPSPALARAEIDARLRALGYRLVADEPRTHYRYRLLQWENASRSSVVLCEHHIVGERYMAASGDTAQRVAASVEAIDRAALLREALAAPGIDQALPWLRRLCLLERDAPSPELREQLTRALSAPDLFVRSAAMAAAMSLAREHVLWALDVAAEVETHAELRKMYRRTAKAERARENPEPRPPATKSSKRARAPKGRSSRKQ